MLCPGDGYELLFRSAGFVIAAGHFSRNKAVVLSVYEKDGYSAVFQDVNGVILFDRKFSGEANCGGGGVKNGKNNRRNKTTN